MNSTSARRRAERYKNNRRSQKCRMTGRINLIIIPTEIRLLEVVAVVVVVAQGEEEEFLRHLPPLHRQTLS